MRQTIAFDLSRMFVGAAGTTPRGIDRIDMGYATRLFAERDSRNVGLVPSPARMGVLRAADVRAFMRIVEDHWRENAPPASDQQHAWLQRRLSGETGGGPALGHDVFGPDRTKDMNVIEPNTLEHDVVRKPVPPRPASAPGATALRYARMLAGARWSPLRTAAAAVPRGAVYVNIGQVLLGWGWFFGWLDRRPDVKPVFMLHDLIPVLFPEYSGPVLSRHHARALRTVVRRAAALIATSHASADEIRAAAEGLGRADLPIHVVPLPVSDSLLAGRGAPEPPGGPPYFVTVGIIDQRKNHRLLLHVWRDMIHHGATDIPTLVIVGSRGLRTAGLLDFLDRCPSLASHVIEVNGLSTPAMRDLVAGARAVLMPSFTEGFGLPVVEALALGTPVIASDIPAHREVGGRLATYLDPLDGLAWRAELLLRAREPSDALDRRRAAIRGFVPQTWSSYFDAVMPVIEAL